MSKYNALWEYVRQTGSPALRLTFAEIETIAGLPLGHAFLRYKAELPAYGWRAEKISMNERTVSFRKIG